MNPLTMGVTMLGTADVVMLAGGELRPAGKNKSMSPHHTTADDSKQFYKQHLYKQVDRQAGFLIVYTK